MEGKIDVEIIGSIFSYWEKDLGHSDTGIDRDNNGNFKNTIPSDDGSSNSNSEQDNILATILGNSILERNIPNSNLNQRYQVQRYIGTMHSDSNGRLRRPPPR